MRYHHRFKNVTNDFHWGWGGWDRVPIIFVYHSSFPHFSKPCYSDVNGFWCQNLKLFICCAFENTHLCISERGSSKACYLSSLHWKRCLRLWTGGRFPGVMLEGAMWEVRQQRIFALTGRRRVSVSVNISISWETS